MNAINTEFQSEHFRLHQLYTMITSEYKSILNCFIKEEILLVKKLSEIDPQDIRNQKPISNVYLGGQCFSQLLNDPLQDESCTIRFKSDCFKFLLELFLQMKKRLPLDKNGIIAKSNILGIEIALDLKRSPTSIVPLSVHFPHIIPQNKLNELDQRGPTTGPRATCGICAARGTILHKSCRLQEVATVFI